VEANHQGNRRPSKVKIIRRKTSMFDLAKEEAHKAQFIALPVFRFSYSYPSGYRYTYSN
jgi:hypothetical protein